MVVKVVDTSFGVTHFCVKILMQDFMILICVFLVESCVVEDPVVHYMCCHANVFLLFNRELFW